jgi:PAS domain S-box-containing protein
MSEAAKKPQRSKQSSASVPIVGLGASAGGLEAFTRLLKQLPPDTGLGFVLVQHLDPQHDSALTQLLARTTSMPVREVTNNLRVKANHVYVIPPNTHLSIAQGRLKLQPRPQTGRAQRAIDVFFESLAQDQGERAIGVILSGTASDGTLGMETIKAEGGITFAQDQSAKYDSMPRSAVAAGCVDFVLSPEHMANELARIAKHPYVAGQPAELLTPSLSPSEAERESDTPDGETPLPSRGPDRLGSAISSPDEEGARMKSGADNGLKKILLLLRQHSGVDFSLYKPTTIQRRVTRRMVLNKQDRLESYATFLRGNAAELDALYSDVLISVTSFFRNPDAFNVLQRMVFPKFLRQRGDDPFRVWVLGCSTGQEAYSIAMAFIESAENAPRMRKLQVFATDLNDRLLDKARQGLYAKSLAQDLSPERLRRFFVEEEGGYRVSKAVREMVVFARQNLMSDPPFSRMDFISCRNLLIYLEPSLQKKVFPTFHYALKPEGFLLLGASESIGSFTDLFEPADKKHKIYSKKAAPTPAFHLPVKQERGERPLTGQVPQVGDPLSMERGKREGWTGAASENVRGELNAQREADRVTVNQFAPPGVLVNADLQILQFRGPTGAYLEPPTGKASFDVLKMAREGLMLPLRAAINKAKKDNTTARKDHVRVQQNGATRTVNVEVIPLKNVRERCFLILFEDAERAGRAAAGPPAREQPSSAPKTGRLSGAKEASRRVAGLETDLADPRDYLQSIQEQHEAAIEDMTERLRADAATASLAAIVNSSNDAIIGIDLNGAITSWNNSAERLYGYAAQEAVGRPIAMLIPPDRLHEQPDMLSRLERGEPVDHFETVRVRKNRLPVDISLTMSPIKDATGRVIGASKIARDITERKQAEAALQQSEGLFSTVVDQAPNGMYVVNAQFCMQQVNSRALPVFSAVHPLIGRDFSEVVQILWGPEVGGHIARIFRHTLETGERYMSPGFSGRRHDLGVEQSYEWETQRVTLPSGEHGVVCYFTDITERKNAEENLRVSEERFRSLVSVITDVSWVTDAAGAFIAPQPEWEAYTGQSWEVHRGFGWADALHPQDRERVKAVWLRACETHTLYESRGRLWHAPTQEWRQYIARAVPLFHQDGSVREWVGTCTDIEELTRSDAALHRLNNELEARVEDRTRELVASQERLRGLAADLNLAEQRERQRLAGELHDYLAQLLVLCKIKLAQAKQQPMAPAVVQAVTDMQEVMDQALTYTRTLVAQLSPPIVSQFGLPMALKWLVEQMHQRDLTVSLELESETLPLPEEQSVLLFQSTRELLMNVVKHAGTKQATIAVTHAEGALRITVSDQGAGFDLAASSAAAAAGTGTVPSFGLFSIRERMLALDGHFELRSRPGEGTTATLVLPLAPKTASSEFKVLSSESALSDLPNISALTIQHSELHQTSSPNNSTLITQSSKLPAQARIRVLLVDDHAMVRQGLRSTLDAYQDISVVGEAADGEEAVELSRALSPDVIVMDVNMPKMDGIEATSLIKARQPGTLIIGLSLSQSTQVRPLLLQAGASGYISKGRLLIASMKPSSTL